MVEVVGIAAIVISLAFVGIQLRQDQNIALAQTISDRDSDVIELSQAIHQNRVVWRAGLDGKELSQDDAITFLSLVRAVENTHRSRYTRSIQLGIGQPARIAEDYAFQLYLYPGLRSASMQFENLPHYVDDAFGRPERSFQFKADVFEALAELERINPPKPEKTYIPFR